jgi:hypothetical protein
VSADIVGRVAAALVEKQVVTVQVKDEAAERRRARDAERKREKRSEGKEGTGEEKSDDVCGHLRTSADGSPLNEKDPHTPKNTNPLSKENPPKGGQKKGSPDDQADLAHVWPADAWDRWYGAYPHKVGKGAAETAFEKIRRSGKVSFDALMAGLEVYKRTKPQHIDWCNPATWLNAKRWDDAPAASKPQLSPEELRRLRLANI